MFGKIKEAFINAISNGGAVLLLVAVLIVGGVAETTQPVSRAIDLISGGNSAPASPLDPTLTHLTDGEWQCPPGQWKRTTGADSTLGNAYIACESQGIIIRHFTRMTANMEQQETALDTNVYPFQTITVEEAMNRVR